MVRILIVEDNEMNRDMLSRRLQRRGYEVVIAADGVAGVVASARLRPDGHRPAEQSACHRSVRPLHYKPFSGCPMIAS